MASIEVRVSELNLHGVIEHSLKSHACPLQDIVMSTSASPGTVNDFLMEQLTCTTIDESITAQEVTNFKTSVILGMTPEQMGHAATHLINFELVVCVCPGSCFAYCVMAKYASCVISYMAE